MGKLSNLAAVKSSKTESFVYTPPLAAFDAVRILVTYSPESAAHISDKVLAGVLKGLRRANPHGRILVIEGEHTGRVEPFLDDNMRLCVPGDLLMQDYENLWTESPHFKSAGAPEYIAAYDCRISLGGLIAEGGQIAASVDNLHSLFAEPRPQATAQDIYFTLGHYFDGAVIDLSESVGQVVWGDDLLSVDDAAAHLTKQPTPEYIAVIRAYHPKH